MGRFDALTTLDKEPAQPTPLPEKPVVLQSPKPPANQFTSKLANQQTSKSTKKQTSLPANQFTSKEVKQQISKRAIQPTTKEKKKYGTYLTEDSIASIQMLAVQTRRKDHEVLQDIIDAYFAKKNN